MLGGAGFIGSHIASRLAGAGHAVTVIDGLLPETGGRRENVESPVRFIDQRIEDVQDLEAILRQSDLIVDAMAWTAHRSALENIRYDLDLNVSAHAVLVQALRSIGKGRVIYLGSRSQYGAVDEGEITEETPMRPVDVQGIHKAAAESYFRINADQGIDTVSLRFPNCAGERQPRDSGEAGLISSMIRVLMAGGEVEVYDATRMRSVVFAPDVAETVLRLSDHPVRGFEAFNLAGETLTIEHLARILIEIVGSGSYAIKPLPREVAAIDIGSAPMSERKLAALLGRVPRTSLREALEVTVGYFRGASA